MGVRLHLFHKKVEGFKPIGITTVEVIVYRESRDTGMVRVPLVAAAKGALITIYVYLIKAIYI